MRKGRLCAVLACAGCEALTNISPAIAASPKRTSSGAQAGNDGKSEKKQPHHAWLERADVLNEF